MCGWEADFFSRSNNITTTTIVLMQPADGLIVMSSDTTQRRFDESISVHKLVQTKPAQSSFTDGIRPSPGSTPGFWSSALRLSSAPFFSAGSIGGIHRETNAFRLDTLSTSEIWIY
ncbi:hypothetical protein BaRGS_00009678 [Batillaria attramentaria]|uniref:Uncharacterized protein n=1 Tax=Batillaria attramentaria TaxID=370345 RepID=A0ABD0LIL7_9CAEN